MQKQSMLFALVGAVAMGGVALASNDSDATDASVKLTAAQTEAILLEAGYTMTEWEVEHGQIEAEGVRDGASWEVVLDGQTGEILSVEADD